MSLEEFLKKTAVEVDREIALAFPKKISQVWVNEALGKPEFDFEFSSADKAVAEPIWDFLSRGGKRWRPALLLLACEAVGGNKALALKFTPVPELVHNGTIMVDDVEDNSSLRRGKPSTHLLFGVDIAVNAGNSMYFLPLHIIYNDNSLSAEDKLKIYNIYSQEMIKLSFGQAMDISWHNGHNNSISEKNYLQMCSYKTASLARFAIQLGAIIGGASEKQISAFRDFATSVGVAFQIQDDILNIVPGNDWGKEIGDDIQEGKRTLMVIRAFSVVSKEKKERLIKILDRESASQAEIKEAISILSESGSVDYAKSFAKTMVSESWHKLDLVLPDSKAKKMLKEFADYLVEREI